MKSINVKNISEEIRYVWECPECNEITEEVEEQEVGDTVACTHCYRSYVLSDNGNTFTVLELIELARNAKTIEEKSKYNQMIDDIINNNTLTI